MFLFLPCQLLASVGLDDYHTLNVWDWKKGKILSSTRGHSDRIFDVQFNPFIPQCLVTCGVKHIKFWTLCGNSLTGKKGIFGKAGVCVCVCVRVCVCVCVCVCEVLVACYCILSIGELQSILCAKFASEEIVYSGTLSGDVYKWKGHTLFSVIKRAHLVSGDSQKSAWWLMHSIVTTYVRVHWFESHQQLPKGVVMFFQIFSSQQEII